MDDSVTEIIYTRQARASRIITITMIVLVILQTAIFLLLFAVFGRQIVMEWLLELVLAILFTLLMGAIALYIVGQARLTIARDITLAVGQEMRELKSANDRA